MRVDALLFSVVVGYAIVFSLIGVTFMLYGWRAAIIALGIVMMSTLFGVVIGIKGCDE